VVNTPAHLIFGAAVFGKPGRKAITAAAILGSLAPDVSLYLMVTWSIYFAGIEPGIVFHQYYYSTEWQQVFAVDNSFVLWGLGFGLAFWSKRSALMVFAGAGLLHLALDFPVHNNDARMHFWPLSDWKFISPISYWDRRFHAGIVSRIEIGLAMTFVVLLIYRFRRWSSRLWICLLGAAELMASGAFRWIF